MPGVILKVSLVKINRFQQSISQISETNTNVTQNSNVGSPGQTTTVLSNFKFRGVLLIWIIVEQGPTVLTVGAGGVGRTFILPYHISFLSPCLWKTD